MKLEPRDFQLKAVEALAKLFARVRIAVLVSPTGSGKTTMACYIVKRALEKQSRVLVLTHRRRLVQQFYQRLKDFGIPFGTVMRDDVYFNPGALIQVASRDTLLARAVNNDYIELPPADLVIVDEGRHAAAPDFRRLLKPYEDNGSRILLLDATPVMPDGTGLGPWAQGMVEAAKVSELVRDGYLVPVKCFAPDRKMHHGNARRGVAGDLVESWKRYAENQPTVLFCSRVSHSEDAVKAYNAAGIPAAHIDAETPDESRDYIFDQLGTGKIKVVSNVGIIKEGVDIPCLGCCQFYMDPKGRVSFLQGVGRVMRPHPGKKYGILIDHAGSVFRHGFPDEDTEWSLRGNVDEKFAELHSSGQTEKPLYCKRCELLYHNTLSCPQCGRVPAKPPRSIFAAPEVDSSNELLVQVDRDQQTGVFGREEQIQHWYRCLATAKKRDGTFTMASAIFKQKYGKYPDEDFPHLPEWSQRKCKVTELYPDFGAKKVEASQ